MNIETHRPAIEHALRTLDSHAFDTKALWRELAARTSEWDRGTPSVDDTRYTLPTAPPDTASHFAAGEAEELSVARLYNGFSYTLTPGQRSLLRDTYGLTPTQTVTCAWVEPWPGTLHPRAMKLVSDLHIDPRARRHVLVSAVIHGVGKFFKDAAALDESARGERRFGITPSTLVLGRLFRLESEERWAIEDLVGVKIAASVEITGVSSDRFVVMCQRSGNIAKVPRVEFFSTVAEYVRLSAEPRRGKRGRSPSTQTISLVDMIAQLETANSTTKDGHTT